MEPTEDELKTRNQFLETKHQQVTDLLNTALEKYHVQNCQCVFPRFQQLISIDCSNYAKSFMCWETEILISSSRKYFDIKPSELTNENTNEKWTCKKCFSIYEYGWSDFSIYVNRQKLLLTSLQTKPIGKDVQQPIPLFLGLMGHSYPERSEMDAVAFEEFKKYILEE